MNYLRAIDKLTPHPRSFNVKYQQIMKRLFQRRFWSAFQWFLKNLFVSIYSYSSPSLLFPLMGYIWCSYIFSCVVLAGVTGCAHPYLAVMLAQDCTGLVFTRACCRSRSFLWCSFTSATSACPRDLCCAQTHVHQAAMCMSMATMLIHLLVPVLALWSCPFVVALTHDMCCAVAGNCLLCAGIMDSRSTWLK